MMDKIELSQEVMGIINNPKAIKTVSTVGPDGVPHTVFKGTMKVLEDGNIGFMEMIENSRTTKNILNLVNVEEEKKLPVIPISVMDPETAISYEIKAKFNRFVIQGPTWRAFLKETWKAFPDIDPVGVWIFEPVEVTNQSLNVRIEEEGDRLEPHGNFWFRYLGPRD